MGKSYKKTPYCGLKKHHSDKRLSNHNIRQRLKDNEYFCNHNSYKKNGYLYIICDYYDITDFNTFWKNKIKDYHQKKYHNKNIQMPNYQEEKIKWEKMYKRK